MIKISLCGVHFGCLKWWKISGKGVIFSHGSPVYKFDVLEKRY